MSTSTAGSTASQRRARMFCSADDDPPAAEGSSAVSTNIWIIIVIGTTGNRSSAVPVPSRWMKNAWSMSSGTSASDSRRRSWWRAGLAPRGRRLRRGDRRGRSRCGRRRGGGGGVRRTGAIGPAASAVHHLAPGLGQRRQGGLELVGDRAADGRRPTSPAEPAGRAGRSSGRRPPRTSDESKRSTGGRDAPGRRVRSARRGRWTWTPGRRMGRRRADPVCVAGGTDAARRRPHRGCQRRGARPRPRRTARRPRGPAGPCPSASARRRPPPGARGRAACRRRSPTTLPTPGWTNTRTPSA